MLKLGDILDSASMEAVLENRRLTDGTLMVILSGRWITGHGTPDKREITALLADSGVQRVRFDSRRLDKRDSCLVVFRERGDVLEKPERPSDEWTRD